MVKCDCQTKPKAKRKPATTKVKTNTVKTNKGCTVKNIIVINNNCCSGGKKTTNAKKKTKAKKPRSPPTPPVVEKVEVIEVKKKRKTPRKREYSSPSPLVTYELPPIKESARCKSPTVDRTSKVKKNNTVKYAVPQIETPKRKRKVEEPPLIEVVDYEEPYNGRSLDKRERASLPSPKRSEKSVTVVKNKTIHKTVNKNEPEKTLRETYRDLRGKLLARRSNEPVGKRNDIYEDSKPTYYVEERPKELSSPKSSVLALPSPESANEPRRLQNCENLSGRKKKKCIAKNYEIVSE